jgi:hypothetical protein
VYPSFTRRPDRPAELLSLPSWRLRIWLFCLPGFLCCGQARLSCGDCTVGLSSFGIGAERFVRCEVVVALHGQAEAAAHGCQFRQRDVTEFGAAQAEVAQTEGDVFVAGVDFRQKPRRTGVRREQFYNPDKIVLGQVGGVRLAVCE